MKKINWGIIGLGNIANIFSEGFLNSNKAKLLAISSHNKSKLEKLEDIEILRFLELKKTVLMKETTPNSLAVDAPSDILKVENAIKKNKKH